MRVVITVAIINMGHLARFCKTWILAIKCLERSYQLDQVIENVENFKYSFELDGKVSPAPTKAAL